MIVCIPSLATFATLMAFTFDAPSTSAQESSSQSQSPWTMQSSGTSASLRGLHVVDKNVVWASGSKGTVIRTTDGGNHWQVTSVDGADELDFRDLHAFDAQNAVILSAGQPARVYRTDDGGQNWRICFEHPDDKSFFDAVSFWDEKHGIAMSDPVDGHLLLIETADGGRTWRELPRARRPKVKPGEAGFAASGTNMCVTSTHSVFIAVGSALPEKMHQTSRIFYSHDRAKTWSSISVPIRRTASSGIFSLLVLNHHRGVAIGGDYLKPEQSEANIAIATESLLNWNGQVNAAPSGYRSCVAAVSRAKKPATGAIDRSAWLIAVGPSGTDLSKDFGQTWNAVSDTGFHAVQFTREGSVGWATGADGRVAKWTWQQQRP